MSKLEFLHEAASELEEARHYYETCRQGLGTELLDEVAACLAWIHGDPLRGPQHRKTSVRVCLLRRFPYGLYYLPTDDIVWIVAVGHHRRRPGYWKRRVP
ncbi:MAG: type II toxin-antitoxin system RelE/ParE family toxin [Pirellula sp.]|nr:type II toxin-antitoxin system RelE/ParE family toxin [Pirellula sp.]